LGKFLEPLVVPSLPKNLTGFSFRPAEITDASAVYSACYAKQNHAQFLQGFRHSIREQERGRRRHLLAEGGKRIVGSGKLIRLPRKAEIADLAVTPIWQRRGIGTAMIHLLIAEAAQWGYGLVEIGAEISNSGALSLYRRLGFGEARECIRPGKEPAILLSRRIKEDA